MYVILDGFDLGIGILFPFTRSESERDQMMRSIAPFWDGNETWLVLGGGGLLVAFPRAYAVIMPALYLPVIVMLLALVFRGVAFEFRTVSRSKTWLERRLRRRLDARRLRQGVILGGLIQGIAVKDGAYAGGAFDWATPFALLCGLASSPATRLLGATWLVMKTEGPVAERARRQATLLLVAVLVFMAAVSLWTPLSQPRIAARWFSLPNFFFLWPVPVVTALGRLHAVALARNRTRRRAVSRGDRAVPARLSRAGDFQLSLSGAALAHDLADRRRAGEPDLHAARHAGAAADDPRLHRLRLLAVPRQGEGRRELSLVVYAPVAIGVQQVVSVCSVSEADTVIPTIPKGAYRPKA